MRVKMNEELGKLRIQLQREIKAVRDLLKVPGVIGICESVGADADALNEDHLPSSGRERKAPLYKDFAEFAMSQVNLETNNQKEHRRIEKRIENMEERHREAQKVCKTKQTEREAQCMDREVRARIDTKISDVQEKQSRDFKELFNKHTMLKQEMHLNMLDQDMLGFLKGFQKEWNKLLLRSDKQIETVASMG